MASMKVVALVLLLQAQKKGVYTMRPLAPLGIEPKHEYINPLIGHWSEVFKYFIFGFDS